MERSPPPLPERVVYTDYPEFVRDAENQRPWVVLHSDDSYTLLGLFSVEKNALHIKVRVESSFNASVIYEGTCSDVHICTKIFEHGTH